jgi:guanosine-3',5'-bis(diphosphate) 3'-pyrophosphohydrolase
VNDFEVTVGDLKQLNSVIRTLQRIEGVQSVERV